MLRDGGEGSEGGDGDGDGDGDGGGGEVAAVAKITAPTRPALPAPVEPPQDGSQLLLM